MGSRKTFDDDTIVLPDFKSDFLSHLLNKNDLHYYLAQKFSKIPSHEEKVVATYDNSVSSNFDTMKSVEDISYRKIEGADQRIIRLTAPKLTSRP